MFLSYVSTYVRINRLICLMAAANARISSGDHLFCRSNTFGGTEACKYQIVVLDDIVGSYAALFH